MNTNIFNIANKIHELAQECLNSQICPLCNLYLVNYKCDDCKFEIYKDYIIVKSNNHEHYKITTNKPDALSIYYEKSEGSVVSFLDLVYDDIETLTLAKLFNSFNKYNIFK